MLTAPVPAIWAHFIPAGEIPAGFTLRRTDRLDRYLVREVRSIRGEAPCSLRPGTDLARIESSFPIEFPNRGERAPSNRFPLRGVVQHLHYTPRSERTELEKISRFESDSSSETTAVLIPIGKSAEWWKLSQDERQVLFQKTLRHEGHHGIGRKYADRIFRRLYHSRYVDPTAPYDFLTYFEFEEMDVPYFRKLISELRDIKNNPEWLYVDFEYEVWMTKHPLSADPASTEPTR
jgi:hypothetical protein